MPIPAWCWHITSPFLLIRFTTCITDTACGVRARNSFFWESVAVNSSVKLWTDAPYDSSKARDSGRIISSPLFWALFTVWSIWHYPLNARPQQVTRTIILHHSPYLYRSSKGDTSFGKSHHQLALQPGVGLGLRYNMPPGLSVPCSISPFVYIHLSQVHGHVIQPSHSWSSSSSCCIQLSVQHLFWDCCVLHSFYMPKPSYSLAFNKPDNVLSLNYGF